ncbi:MAG: ribonuclease HI, partial [Phycisphaerales bacterium]|nr:ribonuclease HI [Phycisphaerales bacterium]
VKTGAEKRGSGGQPRTTNNQMELMAVIEGLRTLKRPTAVKVVTDSEYVTKGMTEWVAGWVRNGWMRGRGKKKEPVKNVELWQALVDACKPHRVQFEHVRGHAGHLENEECDRMAVAAAETARGALR